MTHDAVVPRGRQASWTPPVSWLPRALLEPVNAPRSIVLGWALAFPLSIAIAALLALIAPEAKQPEIPREIGPAMLIGALVLLSPILESLMMGVALLVLLRFVPPTWAVIVSAVGWGIAHSLATPIWGLVIWWPFLIFSTLFVVWRERSLGYAFAMPTAVHALQNLPPALLLAYGPAGLG